VGQMSQISPPIRILLVAVIGLIAVYMLFLRPKPEAVPAPAPAAATTPVPAKDPNATTQSGPGSAVQKAVKGGNDASARADEAAGGAIAETESGNAVVMPSTGVNTNPATQVPATGSSTQPAPITKEALARLPKDVRGAVRDHKVMVLLFYNNRSIDDRAVRRELADVNKRGRQVFVDAHWIKSVARYQAITRGAEVVQSPTVVVVDRNLKAQTLVGFVDTETIDQAALDALRAGGGSTLSDPYLRQIDAVCVSSAAQVKALGAPATASALPAYLVGVVAISVAADAATAKVKAPKKWQSFHKAYGRANAQSTALLTVAAADAKARPAKAQSILRSATARNERLSKRFVAKHGRHGLSSCF
jgi:hypothetical protein